MFALPKREPDRMRGAITKITLRASVVILLNASLCGAAGMADSSNELKLAKEWNASAEAYMDQGAYEEARRLYLRSLPIIEHTLGQENPETVVTLGNLCDASSHLSAYLDAKPLCSRALSLREKVLGPSHPEVARSLSDLGLIYINEGDFVRSEKLLRRALKIAG